MYLELRRESIQDNYREAARSIEEKLGVKPLPVDAIPLKPAVIESVDESTAVVCVYGGLYLPKFRGWLFRNDEVILTSDKVPYRLANQKIAFHPVTKEFSPDILLYGRVGDLGKPSNGEHSSIDDAILMRKFGIHAANLRNLLRVGQNGSFNEDGLYTILLNEDKLCDAFKKGMLHSAEPVAQIGNYAAN